MSIVVVGLNHKTAPISLLEKLSIAGQRHRELAVDGTLPHCIRLLLHVETDRPRSEIVHVFLEDAVQLRPDLVR